MARKFLILVVDDNANNLFTVRSIIGNLPNIDIVEASSGEEALRLTTERNFQLILLDVQMPGMDGYETAEILKMTDRTRDIPIVFLTAVFKAEEFVSRGYAVGAVDYLTKPLDDNILLNRVRHYQHMHEREELLEEALIELRTMRANLLQTEKLSALGPIVAGVSHELNTPLGNVKMATSTMHERTNQITKNFEDGNLTREMMIEYISDSNALMEIANRSVERALNLVGNFKQMSTDQIAENRSVFDLQTLVGNTVSAFRLGLNNAPWKIALDIPGGIEMDNFPRLIEQIVNNVLTNSIRHGFHGRNDGQVRISASMASVQAKAGQGVVREVTLKIVDDGIGIEPANVSRVFDPFFTTRMGQGGSGIGLNICHRIATTLLGGTVDVESVLGRGTTFTLTIPCVAPVTI